MSDVTVIAIFVVTGIPLLSWMAAGSRRDNSSPLFLTGTMAFALATSVYLLGFGLAEIPKIALVRALIYLAVLLMTEFVRRQLEPHAAPARWAWILAFSLLPLTSLIEVFFGVRGALLHHGTLTFLQAMMVYELHRLYQRAGGRGIRIIGIGIAIALLMNLTQITSIMIGSRHYRPIAETPEGLALYLANILCVMLYSIGFWSYSLDVSKKAELESAVVRAAELERRKVAEASAEEMAKVVRERNEMIMINSRFEALNNVGVLNAAVVHELSQPLQKILLNSEFLSDSAGLPPKTVDETLRAIADDARAASEIVHAIRSILGSAQAPVSIVDASQFLRSTHPIVIAQTRAEGVGFELQIEDLGTQVFIEVNAVLFNRVILNIISNSLAAMRAQLPQQGSGAVPAARPLMKVRIYRQPIDGREMVFFSVLDNGPGLPEGFDVSLESLNKSTKHDGLGLGLIISRQILAMWRGTLSVRRCNPGTEVICGLPLLRSDERSVVQV